MGDLIDRDEVIESILAFERLSREPDDYYYSALEDAVSLIGKAPAVDAEPVKHGRWIRVSGYATPGGDPVWKCSECGKGVHVYGIEASSYQRDVSDQQWVSCPNCRAIMEVEG